MRVANPLLPTFTGPFTTMNAFNEKVVLVTGAAGNLGQAVANAFAAAGATLLLVDIDEASLTRVYGKADARRHLVGLDILNADKTTQTISALIGKVGRIDVLCNVAGGFRMGPAVHETPPDSWQFLMDLNATSVINMARGVVPAMMAAGRGKIVNIAAQAGMAGKPAMGAYCASKGAVITLTESLSAELREKGINVNCVMPSIIDTPQNRKDMPDADFSRWVTPQALADTILFLASEQARSVHGAALPVYGLS